MGRISGRWGSYNIPKAIVYLLKGDHRVKGLKGLGLKV